MTTIQCNTLKLCILYYLVFLCIVMLLKGKLFTYLPGAGNLMKMWLSWSYLWLSR